MFFIVEVVDFVQDRRRALDWMQVRRRRAAFPAALAVRWIACLHCVAEMVVVVVVGVGVVVDRVELFVARLLPLDLGRDLPPRGFAGVFVEDLVVVFALTAEGEAAVFFFCFLADAAIRWLRRPTLGSLALRELELEPELDELELELDDLELDDLELDRAPLDPSRWTGRNSKSSGL